MSFKCYLSLNALTPDPDTQLVRTLCNLLFDIYSVIMKLLQSATTIIEATINTALKTTVEIIRNEVTKDKPISVPLLHTGAGPMIATTAISELRHAFAATTMLFRKRALYKSGTVS